MRMPQLSFAAAATILLAVFAPSGAHAACCVFDARSIVLAVSAANASITTAVATSAVAITAAIKGSEAATSTAISRSSQLTADTIIRTREDAQQHEAANRYRVTDPCSVGASTTGLSEARSTGGGIAAAAAGIGRSGGGSGGGSATRGASSDMAKAIDIASGKVPAPAPEIQAQIAARGACETFAGGDGARAAACTAAGFGPGNRTGYTNADIRAETLLDGPQRPGAARKRYTIDADSNEATAVNAFVRNVSAPLQLRDLTPGERKTDEGKRYMALKDTFDARVSLAERPLNRQAGMLLSNTATIPMINELLKSRHANFVTAYLNRSSPNWRQRGISEDDLMNLEVERRHMNLQWQADLTEGSPEEAAKEGVRLMALQLVMLKDLKTELRELNTFMGGVALAQVRTELTPQMVAQHRAAAR